VKRVCHNEYQCRQDTAGASWPPPCLKSSGVDELPALQPAGLEELRVVGVDAGVELCPLRRDCRLDRVLELVDDDGGVDRNPLLPERLLTALHLGHPALGDHLLLLPRRQRLEAAVLDDHDGTGDQRVDDLLDLVHAGGTRPEGTADATRHLRQIGTCDAHALDDGEHTSTGDLPRSGRAAVVVSGVRKAHASLLVDTRCERH
jgi:hypothetical protein